MMTTLLSIHHAFLSQYHSHVNTVVQYLARHPLNHHHTKINGAETVFVNQEVLRLFYRQYLSPTPISMTFNSLEKTIFHCIYMRHHDGFVRHDHLKEILKTTHPTIATPFVIQLLGEYVLQMHHEITLFVKAHPTIVHQFIQHNPAFWHKQKCRVISYWDCYYRNTYKHLKDYPLYQSILLIEHIHP